MEPAVPGELTSYKRLQENWKSEGGLVFRLKTGVRKGYPDWLLVHPTLPVAFAEIKGVEKATDTVKLDTWQELTLSAVMTLGAPAYVAAWCRSEKMWGFLDAHEYSGPFAWNAVLVKCSKFTPASLKAANVVVTIGNQRTPRPYR